MVGVQRYIYAIAIYKANPAKRTPKARMAPAGLTFAAALPVELVEDEGALVAEVDVAVVSVVCKEALVDVVVKVLPPLVIVAVVEVPFKEAAMLETTEDPLATTEDAAPTAELATEAAAPAAELATEAAEDSASPMMALTEDPAEDTAETTDERGLVLPFVGAGVGARVGASVGEMTGVAPSLPALVVPAPKTGGGFAAPQPSQSTRRSRPKS